MTTVKTNAKTTNKTNTETNALLTKQKQQAELRMKAMGYFSSARKEFLRDNLVSMSLPPLGGLYWVEGEELEEIRKWEQENNSLVYAVVRSYTDVGILDSYLFISPYEEEWEDELNVIEKTGNATGTYETIAYVLNRQNPNFSELGYIGIETTIAAGFKRVW